jgi:hypothetical protein
MAALLLVVVGLLLFGRYLREMSQDLCKGIVELAQGLDRYRGQIDDADAVRMARGLAWALALGLLCIMGACLR